MEALVSLRSDPDARPVGASDELLDRVEALRRRLLDVTPRNTLIAYPLERHRTSRRFVRVVDELPDRLFERLVSGKKLRFKGLPADDPNDPPEERTPEFLAALDEARVTDTEYLEAIVLPAPLGASEDYRVTLERALRDRVRARLGWPAIERDRPRQPEEVARSLGIDPSFDLPRPEGSIVKTAHADEFVQTLLFNDDLGAKLEGIRTESRRLRDEKGVHTLFASFGCLEWYETPAADGKPLFSPLLLLPVQMVRELHRGAYVHSLSSYESERSCDNRCLSLRLRRDFGLALPQLSDDEAEMAPEAYLRRVEDWLRENSNISSRWRVRRFVQIGILHFDRVMLYEDLSPEAWGRALAEHDLVRRLILGAGELAVRERLPAVAGAALAAPPLVADADSSQHAVVVAAMEGRDLAVEGPPGTGKSQTITNLIAAALHAGKTVLFLAEKLAALDVVRARLDAARLGEFCLPLHQPDIPKATLLEHVGRRLDLTPQVEDRRVDKTHSVSWDHDRRQVDEYAEAIGATCGPDAESVHEVLVRASWLRHRVRQQAPDFVDFTWQDAVETACQAREQLAARLREFAEVWSRVTVVAQTDPHPWSGVRRDASNPFVREAIVKAAADTVDALAQLSRISEAAGLPDASLAQWRDWVARAETLPEQLEPWEREQLASLAGPEALAQVRDLLAQFDDLHRVGSGAPLAHRDEPGLLADDALTRAAARIAGTDLPSHATLPDARSALARAEAQAERLERLRTHLKRASDVFRAPLPETVRDALLLARLGELLCELEPAAVAFLGAPRQDAPLRR